MKQEQACAVLIKQIHSELEKNANNMLRQDDLTMSQVNVLMILNQAEGKQLELKQLERQPHVAQPTAAGIVKRLEQKGFVEGLGSPEDKRIKLIRITPLGMECCKKAEANMLQAEQALTSALTEAEYLVLTGLLQKIRDSF